MSGVYVGNIGISDEQLTRKGGAGGPHVISLSFSSSQWTHTGRFGLDFVFPMTSVLIAIERPAAEYQGIRELRRRIGGIAAAMARRIGSEMMAGRIPVNIETPKPYGLDHVINLTLVEERDGLERRVVLKRGFKTATADYDEPVVIAAESQALGRFIKGFGEELHGAMHNAANLTIFGAG